MTRPAVDGQPAPRAEPMQPLVLLDIPAPVEPRCVWCGTKMVLLSGYCPACTADMDEAGRAVR